MAALSARAARSEEIPAYLNEVLAKDDVSAGVEREISSKNIRVIALDGFPRTSFPGILGEIDALAMEYRWNTRATLLDPRADRTWLPGKRLSIFVV